MFSDEESVSSCFSHSDSADEPLSDNDYAYGEGKLKDTLSPLHLSDEEPPPKRAKFLETNGISVPTLLSLSVQCIAAHLPFEVVERFHYWVKPVPSSLQLAIMKNAFPRDETCVYTSVFLSHRESSFERCCEEVESQANDDSLVVRDAIQTGFTVTASIFHRRVVKREKLKKALVVLHFDRQRIILATCSVHRRRRLWCCHVVRIVFARMRRPWMFRYRLPMSYCLEQLNLPQHKQLIHRMLSDQPLEFLSKAQKILDNLVEEDRPFLSSNTIPDSTAGAGITEEGVWHVDETSLRRVVKDYAGLRGLSVIGRMCALHDIRLISPSLSEWGGKLASLPDKGRAIEHDEIGETCWSWMSEVDIHFQMVRRLLRKGEELAVRVLSVFTQQWLYMLESMVTKQTDGVTVVNSNYARNISLFTCTLQTCFACRLISYWRLAAMNPHYSTDIINRMRKKHKHWASRLDRIMAAGTQDCRSQGSVCIQKRAQVHVIRSFEGWNGFRHIYAWTSTTTKGGIDDIIKSGSSSKFWCQISNTDDTDAGKKLATVACIVRGFKFYGYAEQSLDLALQAFQSVFSLNLVHPGTKRRSKRVKRRNALADITDQMWGMSSISLSWSLGVILEEMCMQDDAWKRFPDVSNVIALRSLDQPAATSQGTIVFPLPLYLCVYFCTVCDEHVDHFYASATAVSSANEIIDCILHQSEDIAGLVKHLCEAGHFLSTSIPSKNFNFARYSRMLLQASLHGLHDLTTSPSLQNMLTTGITQQATAVATHISGQGSDDEFYYVVTQFGSLLYELLNHCKENEAFAASIIRQALEPIKNCICEHTENFNSILVASTVAASLGDQTVLYRRLVDFLMDIMDVASLACGFAGQCKRWLKSRWEHLNLGLTRFDDALRTSRLVYDVHSTLKYGVLLHIKLLSLTKTLEYVRHQQLSIMPKLLRSIGTGAVVKMLWSAGWEECLSPLELLYHVVLLDDFVSSCQKPLFVPFSQSMAQALCSLLTEAACAIMCPVVNQLFFDVIEKLGYGIKHRLVKANASLCERRVPEVPYYYLFHMARSHYATLQECLGLAVAAYQRLWAYCLAGCNLTDLLSDQRLDSSLLSDIHNLASLSFSCGKLVQSAKSIVDPVLQLVMDAWVDPFITFNVLAEIARVHDLPHQYLADNCSITSPGCWNEPVDCLQSLMKEIPQCSEVLERCKREFISLLTGDRSVHNLMASDDINKEIFREQPMPSDMICLDIILQISPDPDFSIPNILELCKKAWLEHGSDLVDEYKKRKEHPDYNEITRLKRDARHFYYRRILQVDFLQSWQLPVADVLSSQDSHH